MPSAWGKTDPELGTSHHLAHHCADVAAVFRTLIKRNHVRRAISHALGRALLAEEFEALVVMAFLHDIGKLAPGFQLKGWPELASSKTYGHLEAGQHWLNLLCESSLNDQVDELAQMCGDHAEPWFDVIFAHHGRPQRPVNEASAKGCFRNFEGYDWKAEETVIADAISQWFPPLSTLILPPPKPPLLHLIAGLLALADWLGSDRVAFAFVPEYDASYWAHTLDIARSHVEAVGLGLGRESLIGPPDWALISDHPAPRPAQSVLSQVDLSEKLVILEAETGTGKTEAALWHFIRQLSAENVEALYFAVPTRAAARQLHTRITTALTRMFRVTEEPVLAIPGQMMAGEAKGRSLPDFKVLWDDGGPTTSRWAAEQATRYLAARIAVGTVDQIMLAGLQVKHAHLRAAALSRALLVIDEVHASDPWMTNIQKAVLDAHLSLGGRALLMSATLGASARTRWTGDALPSPAQTASLPYPAIWAGRALLPVPTDPESQKDVYMSPHRGWSGTQAADLALEAARDGAKVLVIRNTVDRARDTWQACLDEAPELVMALGKNACLHHSRFAAEDRAQLDTCVEALLGKNVPMQGVIIIGTQTLEQSLDISADLLITDLCPMDVLLQRIGRLHRHVGALHPNGFKTPRCIVLTPDHGLSPLVTRAENGLGVYENGSSISGVYIDVCGLKATLDQIEAHSCWSIPAMNRALVEAATHPLNLDSIAEREGWQTHRARVTGKGFAEKLAARHVILDRSKPLAPFPDDEAIRTRLGAEGVMVQFPPSTIGPFGTEIRRMALPAHWSHGLDPETLVLATEGAALRLTMSEKSFLYDCSGLRKDD
ncbi:CRISPR-associated helicase Cas3' [Citreicella sp. C3M06]|uniref:CRISPR-associated helicase Cas3' n=1 Tax=Citreicella sp. C3M06 TaxID=2841564 RepID=UPI001C098A2E|nr:CRISPR-associated helicase Cas3' [Citreicella sp. C3M06]MBU2962086.1 CRISPR-associated helicase Cas3' [Citreicella sp. C3M06]